MKLPTHVELKEARQQAGLTQNEAAELVYVSLRHWQRWESGDRKIGPAHWRIFQASLTDSPVQPPAFELPPLPKPAWPDDVYVPKYSAEQMQAYALKCLCAHIPSEQPSKEVVKRAQQKSAYDMSIKELQLAMAPLQAALYYKICGDQSKGIGLTVK